METNTCNVNHLDADALLPPRKRLLAGLKRQNSDGNFLVPSTPTPSRAGSENEVRLNNALNSQLSNPNLSNEEIVDASRIAAIKAAKVAEAARANAEEKAAKAAKAVAAAKSALDLFAILSDEAAANRERFLKRIKLKKHVTVEALYNKNKGSTKCRTDEELARKLHRVINSSPRILKNASGSDVKSHRHKRLKRSASSERTSSGVPAGEGDRPCAAKSNGNVVVGNIDAESSIKKIDVIMVDLKAHKHDTGDQLKLDNGEGSQLSKTDQLKLDDGEALDSFGKKSGRMKQKKLPLSICSFKDQTNPKDEVKAQGVEDNTVDKEPLFSMGPSGNGLMPVERTSSMWKCQSFKAPACVKQNKVMQS